MSEDRSLVNLSELSFPQLDHLRSQIQQVSKYSLVPLDYDSFLFANKVNEESDKSVLRKGT